jgi:hypothetical protein
VPQGIFLDILILLARKGSIAIIALRFVPRNVNIEEDPLGHVKSITLVTRASPATKISPRWSDAVTRVYLDDCSLNGGKPKDLLTLPHTGN